MSRSSTFSSELPARGTRHWWRWAALTAMLLVAAEAALRVPVIRDGLPPRTHYYDPSIAVRLDALDRTLTSHGRIDVLFVGSSIVRTNIQPLLFDELLAAQDRTPIISFNAGLSGLWPASVALYLERVWLPAARPRIVVQGIRYPELAAATHALRPEQVFTGTVEAGWSEAAPWTRLKSSVVSRLRLLQYGGTFTAALERWATGTPGAWIEREGGVPIDPRGHTPRLPTLRDARQRGLIDEDEDPSGPVCVPDGCAVGFQALARAIKATRDADAMYVLVNVPEHASRWKGAAGRAHYDAYLTALREFAARHEVLFLDPSGGDPSTFADDLEYADTYHMSPAGADRLTRWLAANLTHLVL